MNFYQIFLPIASAAYFLLVFVLRSVVLWKTTGVNPLVFSQSEKAHDYIGNIYKFVVAGIWVSILLFSFAPDQYEYLLPIWYLDIEGLKWFGVISTLGSFLFTSVAQYQMSKSWRIGIDYDEVTDLVQAGLFKHTRNPIFLGVITTYVGTFLITPNALSLMLLLVIYTTIQIQVRMEEEYLLSVHGANYTRYMKAVSRWF